MKHLLVIEEKTAASKAFLLMVNEFAKKEKWLLVGNKALNAIEEIEDEHLGAIMKKANSGKIATEKEKSAFFKKVGIKAK